MLLNAVGQAYQVNIPSRPAAAERCCPATSGEYSLSRPVAAERRWPVISGESSLSRLDTESSGSVDEHSGAAMDGVPHNCCNDSDNAQLPGDHDIASTPTPDGD